MSKKCKTQAKERRLREKRARKESQKLRYKSYAVAGGNSKSKRYSRNSSNRTLSTAHSLGKCGNIGCIRCFGVNFNPFLVKGKPHRMPQRMYIRWLEQQAA